MSKGKVLVTDPVDESLNEGLSALGYEVVYEPDATHETVMRQVGKYVGLVINSKIKINKALLDAAVQLKFVARLGSGLDVIDLNYAAVKGVAIYNSPEGNCDAVAEHAIGMIFSLFNNINKASNEIGNFEWIREPNRGVELGGMTVGVIGYGHTGKAFVKKLSGFGVKILVYDKYAEVAESEYVKSASLVELQQNSKLISLHVQLTDETLHLVNSTFFEQCSNPIYLVNTSRGKVVNTPDLINGLKTGKVLGAALDVLENERLATFSEQEKADFRYLASSSRVVMTPHIAGWTNESKKRIAQVILHKIQGI